MAFSYTSTYQAHGSMVIIHFSHFVHANHLESVLASVWLATTKCEGHVLHKELCTLHTTLGVG